MNFTPELEGDIEIRTRLIENCGADRRWEREWLRTVLRSSPAPLHSAETRVAHERIKKAKCSDPLMPVRNACVVRVAT